MTGESSVFISYAHADRELVLPLAIRLRAEGFDVFIDEWGIAPGDVVTAELESAMNRSDAGIVVFSTTSVARLWVMEEYYALLFRAVIGRGRLIPVVLDDVPLPEFAGNRQAVDLRGDEVSWRAAVDQLVAGLRRRSARNR